MPTEILGVFQGDIVIRSAIEEGLINLRSKPWLLDFVFASLPQDELTAKKYGQNTIDRAKDWFLKNKITIVPSTRVDYAQWPTVSIKLNSSAEDENQLGDVHYEPREDSNLQWPVLYGPFEPVKYVPSTGVLTLPADVAQSLYLSYGMLIVDKAGGMHPILDLVDSQTVIIDNNLTVDFSGATVRAQPPAYVAEVESLNFKESYLIGCHVGGDQEQCLWLHSILVFILLAYKETLLEGRGFEKSTISSSDFVINPAFDTEIVFSRFITLSGSARHVWPKTIKQKITGVQPDVQASQKDVLNGIVVDLDSDALSQ